MLFSNIVLKLIELARRSRILKIRFDRETKDGKSFYNERSEYVFLFKPAMLRIKRKASILPGLNI